MKKVVKIIGIWAIGGIVVLGALSYALKKDTGVLVKKGSIYTMKIDRKLDNGETKIVEFSIDNVLVDSLKLSEEKIESICNTAVIWADFNVKNKPTYNLPKTAALLYVSKNEHPVVVIIGGTAENSFGVASDIHTYIPFDEKGEVVSEEISSL